MYFPLFLVPPSEEVVTKKPSVVSFRRFSTTAHYHADNRVAHWDDATVGELRGPMVSTYFRRSGNGMLGVMKKNQRQKMSQLNGGLRGNPW